MMKMKWMSCFVLLVAALSLQADNGWQVCINEDFQDGTVGSAPAAYQISQPAGVDFVVVDSGSTPADPFGGAGNQSVYFSKTNTAGGHLRFTTANQKLLTEDVKVHLKYYLDSTVTSTAFRDVIGVGDVSLGTAVRVYTKDDRFVINGSSCLFSWFGLSTDQLWNMEITMDASAKTWGLTVNGTTIKKSGITNPVFDYDTPASAVNGVNMVSWTGYGASGQSNSSFIDDIVMEVPGPATLALLGFAGVAMLFFRRFRK